MRSHLSARSRLTLLYTSLFTLGGAALVLITYLLVAHSLHSTTATDDPTVDPASDRERASWRRRPGGWPATMMTSAPRLYANGVQAGASAQRSTTLTHLLAYSLLTLAGVTLLAAAAGWIVAGRILRPVHRLTAAARAATEQNLSQRIALQGPRDELRELADTFDTMLERLDRAFTSQRQFIANASHELRTPLTVMRTAMDVVLAKPEPTREELVSMAADIRQAVDHSERLIEVTAGTRAQRSGACPHRPAGSRRRRRGRTRGTYRQRHHDDHHARRSPGDRRRSAARTARRQPARQRRAL